ncbi:MAG: GntR family transcriptional regulator [Pseudomonadota bacterium]
MYDSQSPFVPAPQPVSRQAFATARLRSAIMDCELMPGAFTTEAALVDRFGLSKAAVRVALTTLAASGLFSATARRGWRVAPISGATVRDLVAARRRLEPALADVKPTPADISALEALVALCHASASHARSSAALGERQLLDRLASLTHNALFERWLAELWDHSARLLVLCPQASVPDRSDLVEALAAGRADEARAAIAKTIDAFEAVAIDFVLNSHTPIDMSVAAPDADPNPTMRAVPPRSASQQQGEPS